mgnify:CR=1 FL=1
MKTTLIFFLSACACLAQNFAVLTHGAANTPEFISGCPSNWPARIVDIGASTNLPKELSAPWLVESAADLKVRMETLASEKEAWNLLQESAATQPKRDRETAIKTALAELKLIRDSTGTLTGAQLSNAVRAISRILIVMIQELLGFE